MVRLYMKCLQVSRTSDKGFTLIELILGIAMTLTVSVLALAALSNAEKGFSSDKNKIEGGQKLSSVLDIIGRDITQAGEQVNEVGFPVIKVVPDGTKGSRLIVYRALEEALPVCSNIAAAASANKIMVATIVAADRITNPSCDVSSDPNVTSGSYPQSLQTWAARRTAAGGTIKGIVHDGLGNVQMFTYTGETDSNSDQTLELQVTPFIPTVAFPLRSTAYLIEKREYLLCSNTLKVRVNSIAEGDCTTADSATTPFKTVASNVTKMDITLSIREPQTPTTAQIAAGITSIPDAILPYGVAPWTTNTSFPSNSKTWFNLQGVNVQITAVNPDIVTTSTAAPIVASGRFYPRNVLSSKTQ